jgi:hypothetical protein
MHIYISRNSTELGHILLLVLSASSCKLYISGVLSLTLGFLDTCWLVQNLPCSFSGWLCIQLLDSEIQFYGSIPFVHVDLPVVVVYWPNISFISRLSSSEAKEVVHYQTLSPKSLAKSVLEEGGWSNLVVSSLLISQLEFNLTSNWVPVMKNFKQFLIFWFCSQCSKDGPQKNVDVAVLFLGSKVHFWFPSVWSFHPLGIYWLH